MVDLQTVCCMCGDVGFPDKLFRCNKCRHRFQHSYCSNYYGELPEIQLCDWCQTAKTVASNSKKPPSLAGTTNRSEYSGDKIKHHDREVEITASEKGKSPTPSPRTATRRIPQIECIAVGFLLGEEFIVPESLLLPFSDSLKAFNCY
ncbi:uncharacterized protein DS421_2g38790 [Arachis hypogaea]|nr:uncharacterized protein DS421_2g38790 [Arachis hypogaea]